MKAIDFPESNAVLGKDQKEYLPLPVHRDRSGAVVSCWRPSIWQRLRLLFTGRVWVLQLTFGDPLQPLAVGTIKPFGPSE